jgi:hypothetical protein
MKFSGKGELRRYECLDLIKRKQQEKGEYWLALKE